MRLIRYDSYRRRLWLLGARIHHGMVGVALILIAVYLILDDRHDFPWISDLGE